MDMNNDFIWTEIATFFADWLGGILNFTQEFLTEKGPLIGLALLTLAIGWAVAAFTGKVLAKLLRAVGFDVIIGRLGGRKFLAKAEIERPPSSIMGLIVYGILMWTALMLSFERAGLPTVSDFMRMIMGWVPSLLLGLLLLVLGLATGKWLGGIASRAARLAEIPFHQALGSLVQAIIVVVAVVVALDQVGLASQKALLTGLAVFLGICLLAGVFLAVFARDIVADVFARQVVAREFKTDDFIQIGEVAGRIDSLASTSVRVRGEDGREILIPHRELLARVVIRQRKP
jgi:small-conductance mechanosensitive channel